ncbi:CCC motif membrane protein [Flavobacteriaceae bacterium S356]|uniref:CCC motif membrane protein n=1 Tax=Asprobacillus argus TaxID=3076534 RepID=A0ABU3LEK4_9FLAO|nr:CCC motif membrane protein [Flavobacteriaceae bacterium S356]
MENQTPSNGTASLVLGILSILTCICYGILGLPLGIIAFFLGRGAEREFRKYPDTYTSAGNGTAGKILGIIGIVLNLIMILMILWALSLIGWDALGDPDLMRERLESLQ